MPLPASSEPLHPLPTQPQEMLLQEKTPPTQGRGDLQQLQLLPR